MDDLISRQAAIDALTEVESHYEFEDGHDHLMRWAKTKIFALPSAQPEIIRCKNCKNSEHWYRDRRRCFLWSEDGVSVFDDGFCNYAERRQDD